MELRENIFLGISNGIVYPYSLPTMDKPLLLLFLSLLLLLLLLLLYTILYIIMIVIAIIV